jgi:hypothetical protein
MLTMASAAATKRIRAEPVCRPDEFNCIRPFAAHLYPFGQVTHKTRLQFGPDFERLTKKKGKLFQTFSL